MRARGYLWLAIHLLMQKRIFASVSFIFVLLFAVFVTSSASAHGGEPRLEISAERLSPGETLQVRGVEFEYDQEVTIALIGNQVDISLGTLIADAEGVFIQNILLPDSLAEGTYAVRARTYDHVVISPPITIWGIAVVGEDSNTFRDQSDVELGPIPTFVPAGPGVSTASAPIASARVESPPASSGLSTNLFVLAALIVFVIVFVFGMLRKRPR